MSGVCALVVHVLLRYSLCAEVKTQKAIFDATQTPDEHFRLRTTSLLEQALGSRDYTVQLLALE
jgi:hypothetical protein